MKVITKAALTVGAVAAASTLVIGTSELTASMVTANQPAPAPVLYPQLPIPLGHESAASFAQWAFGSHEGPAMRAAAALNYTQRDIIPEVVRHIEDWPTFNAASVIAKPVGIEQTRALVIFAAACRPEGEPPAGFPLFRVDPDFSIWSRAMGHKTPDGDWFSVDTGEGGISSGDCEAAISESADVFDLSRLDPGLDAAAVFQEFHDPTARKVLLGLNGQLPTSR